MSFLSDYFGIVEGTEEVPVRCPFNHYTVNGLPYKETNPSAHVNTHDKLFHCKVCGTGYSEGVFIQKIFDCTLMQAKKIQRCFETPETERLWKNETQLNEEGHSRLLSLGVSENVIQELQVKSPSETSDHMCFPVFMFDHLMDIRTYNPGGKPKVKSRFHSPSGLIIPYDIWRYTASERFTLICAGEKDMAIARSHGFNAITITGGENTLPITFTDFIDRKVAIVYDNDGAGVSGAKRLGIALLRYTNKVKVVTNFHEICKEHGEDITDFFTKYGKAREDLVRCIEATTWFVPTPEDLRSSHPLVDLLTAAQPANVNKLLQSNVQVVATSDSTFAVPAAVIGKKYRLSGKDDTMKVDDYKEWELYDNNIQDILHLIDNNFKEETIDKNLKLLLKIPSGERCVKLETLMKKTVFKAFVTDMFETTDAQVQPMEFTAYCIDKKLESGKKYMATHKLVPHPYKGQQLVMIITDLQEANDSVSKFTVNSHVKDHLKLFRELPGTVEERLELCTEKVKGLLGYNGNNTLIQAIDLSFHTVLQFNFGNFKDVRGYLDTLIVGESRTGKSSTADTLRSTYGLGVFTSLAGNSATVAGLIGGSNKTATGGFQTRAGIIPQNHRGLIIFEEFGKSNANVVTELTDIRSSNEVRISRVSGTLTMPAMVRMISMTNVKNTDGTIKPIASYPNGITIITELVGTAEDIARYDLLVILADRGANQIDPFWQPLEPFPIDAYKTRVRWVWSRNTDQIDISRDVGLYIIEQANELNKVYECHIKIFGTEAWKKITRLAVAVAGYLVSTDDDYNNIIVTKEHVDYAVAFFKKIYDNSTFKLKQYVDHERKYAHADEDAISALQEVYNKVPSLVLQLEQCSRVDSHFNIEIFLKCQFLTAIIYHKILSHLDEHHYQ